MIEGSGRREVILLLLAALFTLIGSVQLSLVFHGQVLLLELLPALEVAVCLGVAYEVLRRRAPGHDPLLLPLVGLLSGLGLLLVRRLAPPFLPRQLAWLALGTTLLILATLLPPGLRWLRRYRYTWLSAGLILLSLTLVFGVNPAGTGARLWLGAAGFYFQPSELLKLLLLIFLASYLEERRALLTLTATRLGPWHLPPLAYLGPLLLMWGFSLVILVWQRDLGTALLFFGICLAMLYIATRQSIYVWSGLLLFAGGSLAGYRLFDHVRLRVDAWLNPWPEAAGRAFQIVQALLAFASGGVLGQGLGLGAPTLIPAVHTDFVFPAIGEELGLPGTLAVTTCFALLTMRGFRVALRAANDFERLLAAGISTALGLQALVIMGGTARLIPLTGVTLPFVSYGGSSLITSFVMVGLLLHISSKYPEQLRLAESAENLLTLPRWNVETLKRFPASRSSAGIRRAATTLLLGFAAVAVILAYWQVARAPALVQRADNPRLVQAELRLHRGRILDRHGAELAVSRPLADGTMQRVYPDPAAAPVTGYYSLRYGTAGIEETYDPLLRGATGLDAWESWKRELLHRPQEGSDVQLTVDLAIQEVAYGALRGRSGAAVVMDPRNGEVLALASNPTYDPNTLDSNWEILAKAPEAPFLNRATQGLYPPGSLFHTVLLAAALETNLISPGTVFTDTACARQPATGRPPLAPLSLNEIYAYGCEAAFTAISAQVEGEQVTALGRRLGLGEAPPLEIRAEAGRLAEKARLPGAAPPGSSLDRWEVSLSPLQMALVVAAIANDGVRPTPALTLGRQVADGQRALSSTTARQIRQAMQLATGQAEPGGIPIAGTMAVVPRQRPGSAPLNWFLAFAPLDSPRVVVVVIVENGTDDGYPAALAARRLLDAALRPHPHPPLRSPSPSATLRVQAAALTLRYASGTGRVQVGYRQSRQVQQ
jgi:cell division protein FtsW (lipid II flippase)/cell division protein FtsI/penicillin-binding protein 2